MNKLTVPVLTPLVVMLAAAGSNLPAATLSGLGLPAGNADFAATAGRGEDEFLPPPPPPASARADSSDIVASLQPVDTTPVSEPPPPAPERTPETSPERQPSSQAAEQRARQDRAAEIARQQRAKARQERLRELRRQREVEQMKSKRVEAIQKEEADLLKQEQQDAAPPVTGTRPASSAQPLPATGQASPWEFGLKLDWRDKYFFRGLDVPERTTLGSSHSGFLTTTGSATYRQGRHAVKGSFSLLSSLDDYLPNGDIDLGNNTTQIPPSREGDEDFRLPKRDRYNEWTLSLAYGYSVHDHLNVGLGLNYYRFSDGRFWQQYYQKPITSTVEASLSAAFPDLLKGKIGSTDWSALPSIQWVHDFDSFGGDYAVAGLSGSLTNPKWPFSLNPFARLSYDFSYNGGNSGWNNFESGMAVNFPLKGMKNSYITVTAGYNKDLGEYGGGEDRQGNPVDRTDDGWWFGATYSMAFGVGSPSAPDRAIEATGKNIGKSVAAVREAHPWTFSGGIGQRSISTSFRAGGSSFPTLGDLRSYNKWNDTTQAYEPLVPALRGPTGDTSFASQGQPRTYENGTVAGQWAGPPDGTSDFTIASPAQVQGTNSPPDPDAPSPTWSGDRRILFKSRTYEAAPDRFDRFDTATPDSDEIMTPYISISRDFHDDGQFAFSLGATYTLGSSALDTGTRLATLSRAYERELHHTFIYNVDERFSYYYSGALNSSEGPGWLVMDAAAYETNYGGGTGELLALTPQSVTQINENEVARVAGFLNSTLDVTMHEIAIPLQARIKLSDHVSLTLSAGPTINIFSAELESEYRLRALDNRNAGVTLTTDADLLYDTNRVTWTIGEEAGLSRQGIPAAGSVVLQPSNPAGVSPAAPAAAVAGGKGRLDAGYNIPGTSVSRMASAARSVAAGDNSAASLSRRDRETELSIGVAAQAGLRIDLDDQDKWFLDVWGKYSYVNNLSLNNGITSADIDASAWSYGVGVGFRW